MVPRCFAALCHLCDRLPSDLSLSQTLTLIFSSSPHPLIAGPSDQSRAPRLSES